MAMQDPDLVGSVILLEYLIRIYRSADTDLAETFKDTDRSETFKDPEHCKNI
jgi:hypothetical protein